MDNPERIENAKNEAAPIEGVSLWIELSPHNTPQEIIGEYRDDCECFRIEFKYRDEEPVVWLTSDKDIAFYVGKQSGRLSRIEIPVQGGAHDKTGIIALKTNVLGAIKGLSRKRSRLNYKVAGKLLDEEFENLAELAR